MRLVRLVSIAAAASLAAPAAASGTFVPGTHAHLMLRSDRILPYASGASMLNYYGGDVIENVKVYAVWWGPKSQVDSSVTAASGGIADWFTGVTNSAYIDWLNEYDTVGVSPTGGGTGTSQHIGRGNYAGDYAITPSSANSGSSVDDTQIQSELNAQIQAGNLPAPDSNTIYMVYFPPGVTITMQGSASCSYFCAYHGTMTIGGNYVKYGVFPDMGPSSACASGCGSYGVTTAHEMVEAITDADIGAVTGSSIGPPAAWYDPDPNTGEIGDICNASAGSISTALGTFDVQTEWSNTDAACDTTRVDANDFSVELSPNSGNVVGTQTFQIVTASTAGSPGSLTLSVGSASPGLTATISPTTVSPGGSATLTVNASTTVKDGQVTVLATAGKTHTAAVLVQGSKPVDDFSLAVSPGSATVGVGGSSTFTVTTAVTAGSPGAVALSLTGAPSGVTGTFNPASVSPGQSSTLTLAVGSGAPAGSGVLTVTGASNLTSHSGTIDLTVPAQPTISITAPSAGATLVGNATVSALGQVDAATTLSKIELYAGSTLLASGAANPFSYDLDTTTLANGGASLSAKIYDAAGGVGVSAPVSVTVNNPIIPPTVEVTSPVAGATVSGTVILTAQATASASTTLTKLELYVDGNLVGSASTSPEAAGWDSTKSSNGSHTATAKAYDAAGHSSTSAAVTFTVHNASSGGGGGGGSVGCGCGHGGANPSVLALLLLPLFALRRRRLA